MLERCIYTHTLNLAERSQRVENGIICTANHAWVILLWTSLIHRRRTCDELRQLERFKRDRWISLVYRWNYTRRKTRFANRGDVFLCGYVSANPWRYLNSWCSLGGFWAFADIVTSLWMLWEGKIVRYCVDSTWPLIRTRRWSLVLLWN